MKTKNYILIFFSFALFSCTKAKVDQHANLTNQERKVMLENAVEQKLSIHNKELGLLDHNQNDNKTDFRIKFAEKVLLSKKDSDNNIHLIEITAYSKSKNLKSFGYILNSNVIAKILLAKPVASIPSGSYTGYMLYDDGCYHHGTFMWWQSTANYYFIPDDGGNNSNLTSVGFEDYCLDDDDFSALC